MVLLCWKHFQHPLSTPIAHGLIDVELSSHHQCNFSSKFNIKKGKKCKIWNPN
jgi:hypothetical protein